MFECYIYAYSSMLWFVHDHLCIPTCAKCVIVTVLSSLPPSDSLSISSGYWSSMLPYLHYAWAPGDSNSHCTIFALWLVTIHVCLRHTTLGYIEHFHIQMFEQGLWCLCSAINTVPGEDGHRARTGRFETIYMALGLLGSDSVYKPPWCGEENSWSASWGGA